MKKEFILIIVALIVLSMACSFSVDLPQVETSADTMLKLSENKPQESGQLSITMGGGRLSIDPGSEEWVTGEIVYNVPMWVPEVNRNGSSLSIGQETKGNLGIPSNKVKNDWSIQLGDVPTEFIMKAGAYEGSLNLGGIPLTSVDIVDGASKSEINFDQLNPVVMQSFQYKTGASQIEINNLGNANLDSFSFDGGAGAYTFDFSGTLQRNMKINVNYGLGDLKIIIPEGVPATITVEGGLNNVEFTGTWNVINNVYSVPGTGPELIFHIKLGLGNLQLISK